jgi:hypothetical protein
MILKISYITTSVLQIDFKKNDFGDQKRDFPTGLGISYRHFSLPVEIVTPTGFEPVCPG